MTTIEPWADLGQTKKQFMAYLLDLTEKRIAEAERMLPCAAHASPANGQLAARLEHFDTAGSFRANWRRHDDNQTEDNKSLGGQCRFACHRSAIPGLWPRDGGRRWRSGARGRRSNER
jgi:hypothetical protein